MQYRGIHAARDHGGREEEQQPPVRDALGSKDTSVLAFGGQQGTVGSKRRFARSERLVKTRSTEHLCTTYCHSTGLGKQLRNKWEENVQT